MRGSDRIAELEFKLKMLNDEIDGRGGHKELARGLRGRIADLEAELAEVIADLKHKQRVNEELKAENAKLELVVASFVMQVRLEEENDDYDGV